MCHVEIYLPMFRTYTVETVKLRIGLFLLLATLCFEVVSVFEATGCISSGLFFHMPINTATKFFVY